MTIMTETAGLYVSCLRPLSTTHGYDKGRIAFWGARKRLGALAVLCSFERRACKQRGWIRALDSCFGARAFRSCFSWFVLWFVLFVVRAFRSFFSWFVLFVVRAFRSCFSWFVLLVVLFVVRAFGFVLLVVLFVVRSFRDSFFWGLVCVFCSMH